MPRLLSILAILAAPAMAADGSPQFADFDGVRVHYESFGSGAEALVFIHGWTCDLTFWRAQAPVYRKHRSLLIDLPGHGESDRPETAYPVELFARSIEAVMNDAHVERAVLVGHSLGAPIAYTFLRLFPQKVKSMVLVDGYVSRPTGSAAARQVQAVRYQQRTRGLSGPAGQKTFVKQVEAMFSDRASPELRDRIRASMLATPEHVRIAAVTSPSELPAPDPAETFGIPVLAILAGSPSLAARLALMRPIFPKLRVET